MTRFYVSLVALVFAGALSAQYTRTTSTATYQERGGKGATVTNIFPDSYGHGSVYVLPFDFPYYDRTFRQILISGHGRVQFATNNPQTPADTGDLTGGVSNTTLRGSVHAISGELVFSPLRTSFMTVHSESGRVVVQWKDAAFLNGSQLMRFDFQIHLLSTGVIELRMGSTDAIVTDTPDFVSGIANYDGSDVTAGFGNVLTRQSTLPANGSVVTFTPGSFMMASGIEVRNSSNGAPETLLLNPNTNNNVFGRFSLTARGAGGTVTSIAVQHADVDFEPITMRLFRDNGTKGAFDGADVQVGTTQSPTGSTSTFSGISEAITTGTTDYIVVVNVGALADGDGAIFSVGGPGITTVATVWGVAVLPIRGWISGPMATLSASTDHTDRAPLTAASGEYPALSFELTRGAFFSIDFNTFSVLERHFDFGPVTTTGMEIEMVNTAGIAITDIAMVRLYRDRGTLGVLDSKDVLLGTVNSPVTSDVFFSGLNEAASIDGTDYLVTVTLAAAYAGTGTFNLHINGFNFVSTNPLVTYDDSGNDGNQIKAVGSASRLHVRGRNDVTISNRPVQGGETDLTAVAFALRAYGASTTVTGMTFGGSLAAGSVVTPRIYRDAGTPGVLDAADTLLTATPAIALDQIAFTGMSEAVGTTAEQNYILVWNVAAAPTVNFQLGLLSASIASSIGTTSGIANGTNFQVSGGGASGVDVTLIQLLNNGATLDGSEMLPIARVQCMPRGLGGDAPSIFFWVLNAQGGLHDDGSVVYWVFLEGSGPLGKLDSTDIHVPVLISDSGVDLGTGANEVTTTRNYLICVERRLPAISGTFEIKYGGVWGGTDLRLLATPPNGTITLKVVRKAGGGGGDDGGCSTGLSDTRFNVALLAAALGLMLVARRTRKRAA